ncbi:hypothetical protein ALT785_60162 [Alteromonas infernus]
MGLYPECEKRVCSKEFSNDKTDNDFSGYFSDGGVLKRS